jgi:hypothetical protein
MQQPLPREDEPALEPGAMVIHDGHDDAVLGSVEHVITDPKTQRLRALHLRPGRADYLLNVPAQFVSIESANRVRLRSDARLEELERLAIESGRTPPTGEHIREVGKTAPSPPPEEVVGNTPGMPSTYDGPATG